MPSRKQDKEDQLRSGQDAVKKWMDDIYQAERREEKWRKNAQSAIKLYEQEDQVDYQFNILYSNTETLSPALYSRVPRPRAQRRFKDEDSVGMEAGRTIQRTLEFLVDDGESFYPDFDSLMGSAVLDALVAGRGTLRFKYDAYFAQAKNKDAKTDEVEDYGKTMPGVAEEKKEGGAKLMWETVCGEPIAWDRFCHGYAKIWTDVPWIAMKWPMTREEVKDNFGAEVAAKIQYQSANETDADGDKKVYDGGDMASNTKIAWIREIWDKRDKKVKFICDTYKDGFLKVVDDPLGVTGFFPVPEPLMFFQRVSGICPQTLYAFYSEQARELNKITARINRLTDACKARGMYDGTIQNIDLLFKEADNALLPAENCAALYEKGGLKNAIWFLPIGEIIQVLAQLHVQRAQIKQVIYEITGVSDILRGSSNAGETATAQRIKDQWGNLRLKKFQKQVQKYAVRCLRIMAEIACLQFGQDTFAKMTGLKFPTNADKALIQQQIAQVQAQMQAQAQQAAMMGQPPAPPQMPPQVAEGQAMLSQPSWEDILEVMKSDLQRNYRIDIETNSTVDAEATEDRENMTEMTNALSQMIIGLQPLIENGSMPFEVAKSLLLAMVRRFSLGDEVEDEIKAMTEPQGGGADPEEVQKAVDEQLKPKEEELKNKFEMEKSKIQMANDKAELARDRQLQQKLMELEQTIFDVKMQAQKTEMDVRQKAEGMIGEFERTTAKAEFQRQQEHADLTAQQSREHEETEANLARSEADRKSEHKRTVADVKASAKKPEPKK